MMIRVRVRYFAVLREQRGTNEEWVDVGPGETLGEIYTRLFPPGREGVLPIAYARNLEYTTAADRPEDGDEISFLPPIGGG